MVILEGAGIVWRKDKEKGLHFTVLAFTLGTGQAIMCAVLMKSKKTVEDLATSWKLGIDIIKDLQTGNMLVDLYNNNVASGATFGSPKCTYNGKTLPCFICSSPNARMTSELLAEMLAPNFNAGLFPRGKSDEIPFLLIDGHHSQT
jgi:hypothetical protein